MWNIEDYLFEFCVNVQQCLYVPKNRIAIRDRNNFLNMLRRNSRLEFLYDIGVRYVI